MEEIANLILEIKGSKNFDISEVYALINKLKAKIKEVLINQIDELNLSKEYKNIIDLIITHWEYPLDWKLKSIPVASTSINEKYEYYIKLEVKHQIVINTTDKEIASTISTLIDNIKNLYSVKLAKCSEKMLLYKLHEFYRNLSDVDGNDLIKIITKCFNVKYVRCENDYANTDYFDSYQSDVPEDETRFCAMVSNIDDSCIEKGVYLCSTKK